MRFWCMGYIKITYVFLALCFIDYIVIPQPKVSDHLCKSIWWFFVPKKKQPKNRPQKVKNNDPNSDTENIPKSDPKSDTKK